MVCEEQDNHEEFCGLMCSGAVGIIPRGLGKRDYFDILRACYLKCTKTIGSLKVMSGKLYAKP